MDQDKGQSLHPSPRPFPIQRKRPLLLDSLIIDKRDDGLTVVAQPAVIPTVLIGIILFAVAAALVPILFLPTVSNYYGIQITLPSGSLSRIGAVIVMLLTLRNAIFRVRRAVIPCRIECSKEWLRCSWPKLFTLGYLQLSRGHIDQAYGGYSSTGDGGEWYVGIVDASGREHRLLKDNLIGGKDAELIGRHLRATLGLPETDQDGPDFKKWRGE